jgi:predicted phage terminase large subunit-like protein
VPLNRYIIVDPANSKSKDSDFTAMVVVGLGVDQHVYLIDAVRDRLNPLERAKKLMELVRKYKPKATFYEESGLSMDVQYLNELMGRVGYSFELVGVKAGGNKAARVETLQPLAMEGRLHFPRHLETVNAEGQFVDVMEDFLRNEWSQWPKPTHDDMLDALARVTDGTTNELRQSIVFPKEPVIQRGPVRRDWDPATHNV